MLHWQYEEKDLRDDVKLNLPDDVHCRVFEVTSGDTGKKYWVYLIWHHEGPLEPKTILQLQRATKIHVLCNCPEGYHHAALTILGLSDFFCKHTKNLLLFLGEKER